MPDLVHDLQRLLHTRTFGRAMRYLPTLASSNDTARAWALDGAPEGAVVWTDFQTAGKGRLGRKWEAEAGQNLLFSIVLRPKTNVEAWGLLTLAASVAVAETVAHLTDGHRPQIKWPNDIWLAGEKCCGMLLETIQNHPTRAPFVILGIGLNVNQTHFPPELRATSLALVQGRPLSRLMVLAQVLARLENAMAQVQTDPATICTAYENRLMGLGKPTLLTTTATGQPLRGRMVGITPHGALRLETATGLQIIHAGEVTFQGQAPVLEPSSG